ncbi:hypothetical protein [Salinicola sp. CPA57]|uniref:hypothetical protein n=1 Tax=Salinicola sp. CPA57 TaxID=1949080 RepID=UPI000DA16412|nr:hypothetical protein [Salinicola sp. CPA57]
MAVAFVYDNIREPILLVGVMILVDLAVMAIGILFIAHGLGRAATLEPITTQLHGRLIEKKVTGSTGNGGRFTTYTYFINDIQLYWPPGAEIIYAPLVDNTITLTVAMINVRSRPALQALLNFSRLKTLKEKPSGMGVVLEYHNAINIHGVLEKYGSFYLLRYRLKVATAFCSFALLAAFLLTRTSIGDWLIQKSLPVQVTLGFGYVVASILATALTMNRYRAFRKWLDFDYDDTSHEERLKGN